MQCRRLLACLALLSTFAVRADPPPAESLPTCPQAAATHDVTTTPDVAGINIGTSKQLSAEELDALSQLGVGWARLSLRWSDVQAGGSNNYDWTVTDANIRALNARGIKVLAILNSTPKWAFANTAGNCRRSGRPALKSGALGGTEAGCIDFQVCLVNPSCNGGPQIPAQKHWRIFVTAVVNRYNGSTADPSTPGQNLPRVDAWEIWNEPNAGASKFNGSLAQYHDTVLAPAVDQIRNYSDNRTAFLVGPALATGALINADAATQNTLVTTALRDALQGSGTAPTLVDAVSVHSYRAATTSMSIGSTFRSVLLSQFGWAEMPLWLTEYGKDSSDGCVGTDATCGEGAQYCAYRDFQYSNWVQSAPPTYDRAFWYALTDLMSPQRTVNGGYGVLGECTVCDEPCNYSYYSKMLFGEMQRVLGKPTQLPTHTPFGTGP